MKYDIVCAGVGGQGVLSIAAVIASSARRSGLRVKQAEEHGMSQRGGMVVSHLRLGEGPVHSDLIPLGQADLIISMEPLEGLRYLPYLSASGTLLTSTEPLVNFSRYPDSENLESSLRSLPNARMIDAGRLAREAGSARATNVVMIGAASTLLPLDPDLVESRILEAFRAKGEKVVQVNQAAFQAGREAARCAVA